MLCLMYQITSYKCKIIYFNREWITDENMQQKALHIKMFELYADFSHSQ